jgi:hypothetical protein
VNKNKLPWFDLNNYEPSRVYSANEWFVEIQNRLWIEACLTRYKSVGSMYKEGLQLMEHIRKYGLLNSNYNGSFFETVSKELDDENQFITNLDTAQAFGFLYYSDKKEEFNDDAKKFDTELGRDESKERLKSFDAKYNHAISTEVIEQADRTFKSFKFDQGSNDEGYRFLKVDLLASNEILFSEFKKWLQIERKNHGLDMAVRNFTSTDFLDWHNSKILAYWDIVTLCKFDGVIITNDAIGRLLFPNEYEVTLSERIRKVISVKAKRVFNPATSETLKAQVMVE